MFNVRGELEAVPGPSFAFAFEDALLDCADGYFPDEVGVAGECDAGVLDEDFAVVVVEFAEEIFDTLEGHWLLAFGEDWAVVEGSGREELGGLRAGEEEHLFSGCWSRVSEKIEDGIILAVTEALGSLLVSAREGFDDFVGEVDVCGSVIDGSDLSWCGGRCPDQMSR